MRDILLTLNRTKMMKKKNEYHFLGEYIFHQFDSNCLSYFYRAINKFLFSDHNSTFEHLHGEIQLKPTQEEKAYTPMLDIYLNSSKSNSQLQNVPSPKRRTSKPRPPPKPSMKQNYGSFSSPSSAQSFNGDRMVTIEEKLENIELREEPTTTTNVPPPVSRNTPPQPAPRKRKGILKQPKVDFDSNFERHAKGYSSCRESSSHKKSPRKISGYQSEMDPNAARSKTCSKRHMRRTKSSEMIR